MIRWRCEHCRKIVPDAEMLRAPHPFEPGDSVLGCPSCHAIDAFVDVCDEPGCDLDASCGWPSDAGYRRTCHKHWQR